MNVYQVRLSNGHLLGEYKTETGAVKCGTKWANRGVYTNLTKYDGVPALNTLVYSSNEHNWIGTGGEWNTA